jgi:hypothetical protein
MPPVGHDHRLSILSGEPAFNGFKDFCPDHACSDHEVSDRSNDCCHDEQQDNDRAHHFRSPPVKGTYALVGLALCPVGHTPPLSPWQHKASDGALLARQEHSNAD